MYVKRCTGGTREEIRVLDIYQPAPLQESDPDVGGVHRISYKVALESLHLNSQKGARAAGGGVISREAGY